MSSRAGSAVRRTLPPLSQHVILIVDDDEYVHATLRAALRGLRATIVRATGAREGLELARSHGPDLAIVDLGLPDADGYELTRRLRRESSLADMRILILTGYAPDERTAREAGADGILGKPFRLHEFLDVVRRQLEPHSRTA